MNARPSDARGSDAQTRTRIFVMNARPSDPRGSDAQTRTRIFVMNARPSDTRGSDAQTRTRIFVMDARPSDPRGSDAQTRRHLFVIDVRRSKIQRSDAQTGAAQFPRKNGRTHRLRSPFDRRLCDRYAFPGDGAKRECGLCPLFPPSMPSAMRPSRLMIGGEQVRAAAPANRQPTTAQNVVDTPRATRVLYFPRSTAASKRTFSP